MRRTVPAGYTDKPLAGWEAALHGAAPAKAKPKTKARKPPLRPCGNRHWPKACPLCLKNEARAEPPRRSSQLAELPGSTFEDLFGGAA